MRVNTFLKKSLYSPIKKIVETEFPNTTVIHSHQSGNEPTGTYVVINPILKSQIGRTSYSTTASDVETIHIVTHWESTIQFEFIGDDSADMSMYFELCMNNPIWWEEFQRNELSYIRKSDVRNSHMKRETEWVERYNIDATFTFSITQTQIVDIIEDITYVLRIWRPEDGVDWIVDKYGEEFVVSFTDQLDHIVNIQYPNIWEVYGWFEDNLGEEFLSENKDKINTLLHLVYPGVFNQE